MSIIHARRSSERGPDGWRKRLLGRRSFLLALALPAVCTAARASAGGLLALVRAARSQIGVTLRYDPAYTPLAYPGGDVPPERGVCTDVVIRAYRKAYGCDLQRLVHEDISRAFSAYPKTWGMKRPDSNIDHRRVPNLQVFFERQRARLPVSERGADYLPGDLVTQMLPGNLPHIVIVSDRRRGDGLPLVIHNIGQGAREEDWLLGAPLTGHYRFAPPQPA
ncbi:MAG: DUF1287 domain-containing protein [Burkholderiaceae bacterium]|jgi:uncharacterized protein YijF (DUF1287 family)|nr:DUF1287 domain-containing protein [Burkholderiaceae bacterium]